MPHKPQEDGVMLRGVHANPTLLSLINDTIGREVVVETRDGGKYDGIFAGCDPDFKVGLRIAHPLPAEGVKQLLPHKDDIIEKLTFDNSDVLCVSVVMHEEKRIKGFATDQEYHSRNGTFSDSSQDLSADLERWEADGDDDFEDAQSANSGKGGIRDFDLEDDAQSTKSGRGGGSRGVVWSPDEMFQANSALGVKTTFDDSLSQYTTAQVEGDKKARDEAEKIARAIERDPLSKSHARLENDDEERDLDKETPEFQVQNHRGKNSSRNSYPNNSRGGGNSGIGSNRNALPAGGRRSDGPSGGGRGSGRGGSYGSGGGTSRSFTNSAMSHGGKGGTGLQSAGSHNTPSGGRYQPPVERPTAQTLHNEFSQWSEMRRAEAAVASAASSGAKQVSSSSGPNTKVFESSHRGSHHGTHSPHNRSLEDQRGGGVHHTGSPHAAGGSPSNASTNKVQAVSSSGPSQAGTARGRQADRYKDLRDFHTNFNSSYQSTSQPSQTAHSSVDDDPTTGSVPPSAPVTSVAPPPPPVVSAKPNAWKQGPPNFRASNPPQSTQTSVTAVREQEAPKQQAPVAVHPQPTDHVQSIPKAKQPQSQSPALPVPTLPSTATAPPQQSAASASSGSTETSSTVTESAGRRAHSLSGSEPASPGTTATTCPPASSVAAPPPQTVIVASSGGTPALSATASSSSIAPVDPTPTVVASSANDSANASSGSATGLGAEKFKFNPDAQPFTPRSAATHTPAPQATPTPQLISTHSSSMPVQTAISGIPQGGMLAHTASPQMFPYAAGAGVYGPMPVYYGPQPVMQTSIQLAQNASPATNVAGGPIVATTAGMTAPRGAQLNPGNPAGRRPQQSQQQIVQGGGVYIPGQPVQYAQQMITQYPVPFYANPYQQLTMASANVPPPSVPPPTSSTVAVAGAAQPSYQVIQTQTQHPQVAYARQYYQGGQPVGYMVATAPRYGQQAHQATDYNGTQQAQQPSSGSSNGNSSNGHNSQPATPGPQPVASPAQMGYPLSGTPQSPHPVVVQVPPTTGPPHHPQHMYVHPQFPFMAAGSGYMMYSPAHQTIMQIPTVAATPLNMAQPHNQIHHQQGTGDQQNVHQGNQGIQPQGSIQPQPYMTPDQPYGGYVHAQQQAMYHQQQVAAIVRQNSLGGGLGVQPNPQAYQPASNTLQNSINQSNPMNQPLNGNNN